MEATYGLILQMHGRPRQVVARFRITPLPPDKVVNEEDARSITWEEAVRRHDDDDLLMFVLHVSGACCLEVGPAFFVSCS